MTRISRHSANCAARNPIERTLAVTGFLSGLLAVILCAGAPAIADSGDVLRVASVTSREPRVAAQPAERIATSIESEIAREVAKRWQLVVDVGNGESVAGGRPHIRLRPVANLNALSDKREVIALGHQVAAAALVRPGAAISHAAELKGRAVCVARDGKHVGVAAALHGAVEQSHPTLTSALVALRNGECDAVMHDDAVLLELTRRPEWSQYPAPFAVGEARTLAFIVPSAETAIIAQLRKFASDWNAQAYPASLAKRVAADVTLAVQRQSNAAAAVKLH